MSMGGSNITGGVGIGPFSRPVESRHLAVICAAIITAVGAVDLLSSNVNLAILYALPVVIAALSGQRLLVAGMTLIAICLSYTGYFIGPQAEQGSTLAEMFSNYRFFNRTLCVATLLAITGASFLYINVHSKLMSQRAEHGPADGDRHVYNEVLRFFEQLTASLVTVMLIVCVAVMDWFAPREFNLAILYVVPLVSLIWVNSRKLLWGVFVVLLICTFAGFALDRFGAMDLTVAPHLLRNRFLAGVVLMGCTALLHFAMGSHGPTEAKTLEPEPAPAV
jgi:hypothetical protein